MKSKTSAGLKRMKLRNVMTATTLAFTVILSITFPGVGRGETLSRQPNQPVEDFAGIVQHSKALSKKQVSLLSRIIEAYPAEIQGVESDGKTVNIKMRNGATVLLDDGSEKTPAARLDNSNVKDMFSDSYPLELPPVWPVNLDPGRYRSASFFKAVYGDSEGAVEHNLTKVAFCGKRVSFSKLNGAADALEAVGKELDTLAAQDPMIRKYIDKLGGTFNWRPVVNTHNLSAHSYGIAIDLNPDLGPYWENQKGDLGNMKDRRAFPPSIVAAFERHGFIWGGKWYHFDLMHFEYRPEILAGSDPGRPAMKAAVLDDREPETNRGSPVSGAAEDVQRPQVGPATETPNPEAISGLLMDAAFKVSPFKDYTKTSKIGIVRLVQDRLAYEGFYSGPLNGNYDESTELAIKAWQKTRAMAVNGLLDGSTIGSLGLTNLPETRQIPIRGLARPSSTGGR